MVDTHSTSSGETETESEPEPVKTSKPAPTSSSEESGSEESESEESVPNTTSTPTVKTMPIETAKSSSEESESESEPGAVEIDQSKAAGKRPMPDDTDTEGGNAKRAKMGTVILQKQLFQRLYTQENEIELIQGMIAFVQQQAKDPLSDAPQFYEYVKGSLTVDVTYKQLISKIRKLKLKFRNNAVKIQKNGKVKSLNNVHEKKMYELSEKVWGNDIKKKVKSVSFGNGSAEVKYNIPDEITRNTGFEKLSDADKTDMEKKWDAIKVQELELYIRKVNLMKEQAQIVLDAAIKSGKC